MNLEILERTPSIPTHTTPLLFVHGMYVGAWMWEETFLPYFADNGYRSLALSLRGHGGSDGHAGLRWYSISEYVQDLADVIDQIGTPPVIIGTSMGGFIAQKYLEKHDLPAGVLMASVAPFTAWPTVIRLLLHEPLPFFAALLTLRMYRFINTPQLAGNFLLSPFLPKQDLLRYHSKMQDESVRAFFDLLGLNLVRSKSVKTPLLVLGAEHDWAVGPDMNALARIYHAPVYIVPSVGHYMSLDPNWIAAADYILNWLNTKGI